MATVDISENRLNPYRTAARDKLAYRSSTVSLTCHCWWDDEFQSIEADSKLFVFFGFFGVPPDQEPRGSIVKSRNDLELGSDL